MIHVFCGPIGCGKSTFASDMAEEGALVVNDDAIVTGVHGGCNTLYDDTLKPLYKGLELAIIHAAVGQGRDVIIDRPNPSKHTRMRYVQIAKALDQAVSCHLWDWVDPEISAANRFYSGSRGYTLEKWVAAAERMHQSYETPTPEEGYAYIFNHPQNPPTRGRIYISGPMRGKPLYNFPAFDEAAEMLRGLGWEVCNPAEMDRGAGFNPETDVPTPAFLRQAYRRDAEGLSKCTAIYMLEGWEHSEGANWELHDLAEKFGLEVYHQNTTDTMKALT